jgi:thiamine pyrophosphokinase
MYHYVGKNSLAITEFLDGDYNSSDEWTGDFDSLTEADAKRIAQKYSVYLEK